MSTERTYSDTVLETYIKVCNDVIHANKDRFPYAQIWQAAEQSLLGRCFRFEVTQGEANTSFVASFYDGHIYPVETDMVCHTVLFTLEYLQDVIKHPEKYIENPSLIDWNWLQFSANQECRCALMQVVARKLAGTSRAGIM